MAGDVSDGTEDAVTDVPEVMRAAADRISALVLSQAPQGREKSAVTEDPEVMRQPVSIDTTDEEPAPPRTVWVISQGAYSDYRVMYVCESQEHAERAAAIIGKAVGSTYDEPFAEELPLLVGDPHLVTVHQRKEFIYDDGTTRDAGEHSYLEWDHESCGYHPPSVTWGWRREGHIQGQDNQWVQNGGWLTVRGTDPERVAKVFGERRAWLQTEEGPRLTPHLGS